MTEIQVGIEEHKHKSWYILSYYMYTKIGALFQQMTMCDESFNRYAVVDNEAMGHMARDNSRAFWYVPSKYGRKRVSKCVFKLRI